MTHTEFAFAMALDLTLGDPRWLPHPVRGIGWMIARGEGWLRRSMLPLKAAGALLCVCVAAVTAGLVWVTLPWATVYWVYSLFALRSLDFEATRVIHTLQSGDISGARLELAGIVGRDTAHLDEAEIVRAVVETVSENFGDGVVAPLFYLVLFGAAGMAAYKAVNTLDSMLGYKDERYREFGWSSARLDDILNYVPARLSALLVWLGAALLGMDFLRSVRVTFRDAPNQPSPNSGWPEAAFAGALRIRLGGMNHYHGVESRKAWLGDAGRPLTPDVFRKARVLLYAGGALAIAGVMVCL